MTISNLLRRTVLTGLSLAAAACGGGRRTPSGGVIPSTEQTLSELFNLSALYQRMGRLAASGPMPFVELSNRPTLLAYDALQLEGGTALGSSVATAYAAGSAAALLSAGVPREQLRLWLQGQNGKMLQVPAVK